MIFVAKCLVSFLQGCAEDSPEIAKFIGKSPVTSSHKRRRWKTAKHWFCWIPRKRVGSTENDCVVKFSQLNPNLRRVQPFGGIFGLHFSGRAAARQPLLTSRPWFLPLQSSIPVATRGALWVNPRQTKLQSPPNWNNKHQKSGVFVKILDVKPPCTNVKTLVDFLTTVLQSSMEDRKKLVIHLRSTWMTYRIRYFPLFRNSISPRFSIPVNVELIVAIHHPPLKQ